MITNQVVEEAMRLLTTRVNTSSLHVLDKATIVDLFRRLRDAEEHYDPEELRSWAITNGWNARASSQLQAWSSSIQQGRRVHTVKRDRWKPDIVDKIRQSLEK